MKDTNKILTAKINTRIEINNHKYIRGVRFFYEKLYAYYSYEVYTSLRNFYPSKNEEFILTFKTLNGAKRNFIKNYYNI